MLFSKMTEIYIPDEDSYLLKRVLENYLSNIKNKKDLKFLDMGSGSGILAKTGIDFGIKKENVFLVDINEKAVKELKKKFENSQVVKGNLFSKMNKEKFDLIVFNPPYLPEDKNEPKNSKLATTGGEKGSEIINEFLKNAKKFLDKNGRIFLLTSSLTKNILWKGWKKKLVAKKKIFFEELYVWQVWD